MFDILDFTEDEMKFKTFLKNVRARGGADGPEDMVGGLEKAVQQQWRNKSTKVAVLVADYPCHGQ